MNLFGAYSLYVGYGKVDQSDSQFVKGIECVDGDGTPEKPYTFKLVFADDLKVGDIIR